MLILLILARVPLFAQYAQEMAAIAEQPVIELEQAVWLIGSAAGSIEPGTPVAGSIDALAERAIRLPAEGSRAALRPVAYGTFAELLLRVEETEPGFWYSIIPTRLSAFSLLRARDILPPDARVNAPIDGRTALETVRRYLASAPETEGAP